MKLAPIMFPLKSLVLTQNAQAFAILRRYMALEWLNNPECTLFYDDVRSVTMDRYEFEHISEPSGYMKHIVAFVCVAGLDDEDEQRSVLAYASGEGAVKLHFPGMRKLDGRARRLADSLKESV